MGPMAKQKNEDALRGKRAENFEGLETNFENLLLI